MQDDHGKQNTRALVEAMRKDLETEQHAPLLQTIRVLCSGPEFVALSDDQKLYIEYQLLQCALSGECDPEDLETIAESRMHDIVSGV